MKRFKKTILCITLLAALVLTSCAASAQGESGQVPLPGPDGGPEAAPATGAEALLASMSLREKVGQLFIVRPDALDPTRTPQEINDAASDGVTGMSEGMELLLASYPAGGFVIFGKNIESAQQLDELLASLRASSTLPPLLCVDEEGGIVARIANSGCFDVPRYDSMAAVGAAGDPQAAYDAGRTIGGYLSALGFTLDFAPVADVNTNPDNPVIGERAFSDDPVLAAQMVAAAVGGLHDGGVMACVKHYPGHGDTVGDTHDGFVATDKTWDELAACELLPFISGIDAGADMVMVAHINVAAVDKDGLPASMSPALLTGGLREKLGYGGVIITDSMAMGAVTQRYTAGEAALAALTAGVDIVLMPEDYRAAFDAVVAAVESGAFSEEQLDAHVLRVLALKEAYGLLPEA